MEVKLKVLSGSQAGVLIPLKVTKFLIGRAEDCNLRPGSDLISRHHCVISIEDKLISLRDFGSKNGTYVNDQRLIGECILNMGDTVQIGPLRFEVQIEHKVGGKKRPAVKGIEDVAARTADNANDNYESDISQWLDDNDPPTASKPTTSFNDVTAITDTQSFSMSDTDQFEFTPDTEKPSKTKKTDAVADSKSLIDSTEEPSDSSKSFWRKSKKKKKEPGKLPPMPKEASKDSREAASDMLRKITRGR